MVFAIIFNSVTWTHFCPIINETIFYKKHLALNSHNISCLQASYFNCRRITNEHNWHWSQGFRIPYTGPSVSLPYPNTCCSHLGSIMFQILHCSLLRITVNALDQCCREQLLIPTMSTPSCPSLPTLFNIFLHCTQLSG